MNARSLVFFALLPLLTVAAVAQNTQAQPAVPCPEDATLYQGGTIAKIRITSPFDFLPATKSLLTGAGLILPSKVGAPFDDATFSYGARAITTLVRTKLPSGFTFVRLVATHGVLENCTADTVEIHYTVFTVVIPRTSGNFSELASSLIKTPASAAGSLATNSLLQLIPSINYNQTRGAFGGVTLDQPVPLYLFDHLSATPLVSSNSTTGAITLTGTANPAKEYLNTASWQLSDQYYDVPVGASSLQKALLSTSFFGSTKELASAVTMRFGASVGGGHVQDATGDTPNSSYGEAKLLTGVVIRKGSATMAVSYGFEAGTSISSSSGTFEKHIFDGRYAASWSPLPKYLTNGGEGPDDRAKFIGATHRPLSLEVQGNGGFLTGSPVVPSVERFLGGNQSRPFLPGQTWDVSSQPFIRSITENQLGIAAATGVVGGRRFYSANVTVAKAIWGRSLIPKDLGDPEFLDQLGGAIKTAKGELSDTYYGKDPAVAGAAATVTVMGSILNDLKQNLASLSAAVTASQDGKTVLKDLNHKLLVATLTVKAVSSGKAAEMSILMNTQVPGIESDLDQLTAVAQAAHDPSATSIQNWKSALGNELTALETSWAALDSDSARKKANVHAQKDFAPAESILDSLLYKVNVYSIAPVGIFDIARIWPESNGTRYGVGGGVQLSIVNANFTVGYAANPTRPNHETVGAVFFKLAFTDIFH